MAQSSRLRKAVRTGGLMGLCALAGGALFNVSAVVEARAPTAQPASATDEATSLVTEGRQTFRFDTFGDEAFWGDTLQLHKAIAGAEQRRRRAGREPEDGARGRPEGRRRRAADGRRRRRSRRARSTSTIPATTLALLKLNAVVGVNGVFDKQRQAAARSASQCALCHSTVDDSFAPGIGKRLDGWPNRDLNVGAIVSLAPNLQAGRRPARRRRGDGARRCSPAGARASSTPSCSSTARRSVPTARPRRR